MATSSTRSHLKLNRFALASLVVALLIGGAAASLAIGSNPIPVSTVWEALTSYEATNPNHVIVVGSRLPRTLTVIVVGIALGVAGTLMQSLTRNPLADPGILGVNAGAAVAIVIAIAYAGVVTPSGYIWWALIGASIAAVLVYLVGAAHKSSSTPARIALAGAALSIAITAITNMVLISNESIFLFYRHWAVGSAQGRGLDVLVSTLPFILVGVILAFALAHPLNAIALGDDAAKSLGVNATLVRSTVAVAVVLTAGGATAAAGPIAFVGLAAPHIVRRFTGANHWTLLAGVIVVAPAFLLLADVLGRVVGAPGELQTGIAAAALGGPIFVALVRSRKMWSL